MTNTIKLNVYFNDTVICTLDLGCEHSSIDTPNIVYELDTIYSAMGWTHFDIVYRKELL